MAPTSGWRTEAATAFRSSRPRRSLEIGAVCYLTFLSCSILEKEVSMKMKSHGFWLVMVCLTIALKGLAQEAPTPRRLSGVTSSNNNPLQIAILHWYNANLTTSFSVGTTPQGVAFDGTSMWVTNNGSND